MHAKVRRFHRPDRLAASGSACLHGAMRPSPFAFPGFLRCAIGAMFASAAVAQCDAVFAPGLGQPGVGTGPYSAALATTLWDPDGAGPLPPRLVVAGRFQGIGDALARNIAWMDTVSGTWSAFGAGITGEVYALAVMPNGDLVAAGSFATAGTASVSNVARWDGTAWQSLGSGVDSAVQALAVQPNGDLLLGGYFHNAGAVTGLGGIARWDGVAFSAVGGGTSGGVLTLGRTAAGDILAGGVFAAAGGVTCNNVARFDGTAWHALGNGTNNLVFAILGEANGDIVIGGNFTAPGAGIARWDGVAWQTYGSGITWGPFPGTGYALRRSGSTLFVGGDFVQAGGVAATGVARWNGSGWQAASGGLSPSVLAFGELPNGDIVACGGFTQSGSTVALGVARWTGTQWLPVDARGISGPILALTAHPDGGIVAGGTMRAINGIATDRVARWRDGVWSAIGAGVDGPVKAICVATDGRIYIGGNFLAAGGLAASRIACWNGTSWQALGSGVDGEVHALQAMPNGDVIVGGQFLYAGGMLSSRTARWDGSAWHAMPGISGTTVEVLHLRPNGDLLAGGQLSLSSPASGVNLLRWTGSTWVAATTPQFLGVVNALASLSDGSLAVAGNFTLVGANGQNTPCLRVARWDGTAITQLGAGLDLSVHGLAVLPGGDLIAAGDFLHSGAQALDRVARWDGTSWLPVDGGCDQPVLACVTATDGSVHLGGDFLRAGSGASVRHARIVSTCPAGVVGYGAACTSSVGPMDLSTTAGPWTGGVFASACSGFAAGSLGAALLGFTSPALPLVQLHPAGVPGCLLLATDDAVLLALPAAGVARAEFPMPTDPAFVGFVLRHQMLQLELGAGGAITRIAGSQGLALTIGAY